MRLGGAAPSLCTVGPHGGPGGWALTGWDKEQLSGPWTQASETAGRSPSARGKRAARADQANLKLKAVLLPQLPSAGTTGMHRHTLGFYEPAFPPNGTQLALYF